MILHNISSLLVRSIKGSTLPGLWRIIMSRRKPVPLTPEEEAEEVQESIREEESQPLSEEEGEDLLENQWDDYQSMKELDQYESDGIDNEFYEANPEARRRAEKELDKKEFEGDMELMDFEGLNIMLDNHLTDEEILEQEDESYEEEAKQYIDAWEQRGGTQQWLTVESVKKHIRQFVQGFIARFTLNHQKPLYLEAIRQVVYENQRSLLVQYDHILQAKPKVAEWLGHHPLQMFPLLNASLRYFIKKNYPKAQFPEVKFRVFGLPYLDKIRFLTNKQLGKLINIKAVVTSRSEVFHNLTQLSFICTHCGQVKGPFYVHSNKSSNLGICSSCQRKGPYKLNFIELVYQNFQNITIQESVGSVPPGRIPRSKNAVLTGDLIDTVRPGEEIQLVGVYSMRQQSLASVYGFPTFNTFFEVNSIRNCVQSDFSAVDEEFFENMVKQKDFAHRFYHSIAPSIYSHFDVKRSLALALMGGVQEKGKDNMHRTRADINVLLMGDPGLAKSQFLKSMQNVSPKSVYTSGKGASGVGLTACVKKDAQTKEWRLQAGAMVMADLGMCLIDEFDKMGQGDRTSIHEAMEQQTISVSKAGIVTTLRARCSVVAAANPYSGQYCLRRSFAENAQLSQPILSRFDMVHVIRDKADEELDRRISNFVIGQHMNSHPYTYEFDIEEKNLEEGVSHRMLDVEPQVIRQFISYARQKYHPKFTDASSKIIKEFYNRLRKQSMEKGGMNITSRHLESMVRMCEAHARLMLRRETNQEDAKVAVAAMLGSFIETQRPSAARKLRQQFKHYLNTSQS